jgi:hypothetical protein
MADVIFYFWYVWKFSLEISAFFEGNRIKIAYRNIFFEYDFILFWQQSKKHFCQLMFADYCV